MISSSIIIIQHLINLIRTPVFFFIIAHTLESLCKKVSRRSQRHIIQCHPCQCLAKKHTQNAANSLAIARYSTGFMIVYNENHIAKIFSNAKMSQCEYLWDKLSFCREREEERERIEANPITSHQNFLHCKHPENVLKQSLWTYSIQTWCSLQAPSSVMLNFSGMTTMSENGWHDENTTECHVGSNSIYNGDKLEFE